MGSHTPLCKGADCAKPFPQRKKTSIYTLLQPTHGNSVPMNTPHEMSHDEVQRVRLEVLRREHRDLDEAIHALEEVRRSDQLTIRRLKTQKLRLKDQIAAIEDDLTPDIIA